MTITVNAVTITDMLTVLFLGHRTGVPKIAVVITDGNSANRANTFAEAKKARDSGIQVIAIGVGHGINQKELEGIASSPKSQYVYNAENFDVLNTLQASLSSKTCEGMGSMLYFTH